MSDGLTFGRYQLLERVAAGGMGEVWVGLQTGIGRFQRPVAVKLLLPHLIDDERLVKMFLQEARIGAQMTHANVVQVYDVGFEHDRYFIVMELVRGVSLSKLIAGLQGVEEKLSTDLLAFVGRGLCEGLHVAHEARAPDGRPLSFVHRDVTPHNVLVSVDGAVKLTDFGIARVAEGDRLSKPGVVLGKLGYLPPEQILGQPIDARADVFAAGATLFHLAALTKPFDSNTGVTLDPMRLPLVPLRVLRPDLPRDFCEAIEQAMRPSVDERFASARDFRNAMPVPTPEAPEQLGVLIRRVCAAALFDLEAKTERAGRGLPETQPDRPSVQRKAPPPAEPSRLAPPPATSLSASSLPPLPKSRRGPIALVLLAFALGAGGFLLLREERRPAPVTDTTPEVNVLPPLEPLPAVDASTPPPPLALAVADAGATEDRSPGALVLDATPWAEVTVDGRRVGETPLANVSVPPGLHTLVFRNPETGKSVRRVVTVYPGQRVSAKVDLR
ncbi:MAG: protein kinase [Myxococcaceae bacterium]|nr:protein kinase [Myxococcaceae bacterium]